MISRKTTTPLASRMSMFESSGLVKKLPCVDPSTPNPEPLEEVTCEQEP